MEPSQPPPPHATKVSCGGEHTLVLRNDGQVLSAGVCGLALSPAVQEILMKKSLARSIVAGAYHNLIVKDCGSVLSWGCGVFTSTGKSNDGCIPALGLVSNSNNDNNKNAEEVIVPTLIPNVRAIAAAAGGYHSVLLENSTGRVLTFGAAALGQLGRGVSGNVTDSANLPVDPIPAPVELPVASSSAPATTASAADMEVTSIGAGFYNTLITTRNGHLYCAGENQYQQCGSGPINIHAPMQRVTELDHVHVVQADGGYCHTLARTIEGYVYSLGCSEDGARGVIAESSTNNKDDDDDSKHHNPLVLPIATKIHIPNNDRPIVEIAAGLNHSLARDNDGNVYAWGSNEYGQLNVPGDTIEPKPVLVPSLPCKAIGISAGSSHSAILGENGIVYTFGNSSNGQLGTGSDEGWTGSDTTDNNNPNDPGGGMSHVVQNE